MVVAIHQPNYAPWLGYFHKIRRADVFVFLDDAQFSKNGYINRVRIDDRGAARWLTIPVRVSLGDPINRVVPAGADWARAHRDTLRQCYGRAPAFGAIWSELCAMYESLAKGDIAASNETLVEAIARRLGLGCRFVRASQFGLDAQKADDRLIALVKAVAPGAAYLSGRGGAKYQDPAKFAAAGIPLVATDFVETAYDQGHAGFVAGLSVLDALFRLGWDATAELLAAAGA